MDKSDQRQAPLPSVLAVPSLLFLLGIPAIGVLMHVAAAYYRYGGLGPHGWAISVGCWMMLAVVLRLACWASFRIEQVAIRRLSNCGLASSSNGKFND